MTFSWTIPLRLPAVVHLVPPPPEPSRLRVIVPTFRDWPEARLTVEGLLACSPQPAEIVLVDDNGGGQLPRWARRAGIRLVRYQGNRGPAFARNAGLALASQRAIEWIHFTDTGCLRPTDFFARFADEATRSRTTPVAFAAPVRGRGVSHRRTPINAYMTEEEILNPPRDADGPQAIITANAFVSVAALARTGGFRTDFPFAAAEDLDLGLRLRHLGRIDWLTRSVVTHPFPEAIADFDRRFERYGRGNAHLQHVWRLPTLRVPRFLAASPDLQWLADRQVAAMNLGFDAHLASIRERRVVLGPSRGVLSMWDGRSRGVRLPLGGGAAADFA